MSEWRVACVRIPRFPIGAVFGCESGWDDRPLALVEGASVAGGARLRMVSAAASARGVRSRTTVAAGRALEALLEVRAWDDAAVARATTQVTAALVAASPQVSPVAGAPGTWWVGASGFAGLGGERVLAERLLTIARRWHPRACVAVADSCVAARTASWASPSRQPVVVPRGDDAEHLALAPLSLLPMDADVREALAALGLRTIGRFAALDAGDVERRWGERGLASWRLAHGDDPRRPVLAVPETEPAVEAELPAPARTLEPVLFVVKAAVDRLVREAAALGRAVSCVIITLRVDDTPMVLPGRTGLGRPVTRRIEFARPVARAATAFELCRSVLDRWTLEAPVLAVRVSLGRQEALPGEQGDLLALRWRDPGAIDAALARIAAECGAGAIVRPVARDAHRPDAAGAWVPLATAAADDPLALAAPALVPTGVPLRTLEPAESVVVEAEAGVPRTVTWRGRRIGIERAVGPERLAGEWWSGAAGGHARDYWRCEGPAAELLLYQDRQDAAGGWYVQGWFD